MMRVLSVVWFKVLPPKYGGQKGTALFNQALAPYVELTCICSKNNVATGEESYAIIPTLPVTKLQLLNPICWYRIIRQAQKVRPDFLFLEYPYHGIAALLAQKITGGKLVLHQHNIEFSRFKALGKWWWPLLFNYERWICKKADLVLCKTEKDFQSAHRYFNIARAKSLIVPYGISPGALTETRINIRQLYNILPEEKIFLFAGTLDYSPNADAVENIYNLLAP
ncbi:MAG TPA: glycosyltransferase family 4 protein, partial [Chitinophagaceae bacterium]|nr:glycosyltransferase family 4 protein [Chitinophagaceae bacterium]